MKLPLKWLKEYIDVGVSPEKFAADMTMSGSKVEGVTYRGEGISRVVAGRVLSCAKHPGADKLTVCKVDAGGEPIQIVTGATNVFEGALVPVALHNSTLPGGVKIQKGKLRGELSEGMMCSIDELNLTRNEIPYAPENGILILQNGEPGEDICKVLGLDEYVVEFEITNNRPDCMNVIGLAREAAATYRLPFASPKVQSVPGSGDISEYLSVEVSDADLCPRYCARVVKEVKIEPSPAWLRERLAAAGVRPINNIVDITNYVMLEYGQPMHAFDYSCLSGSKITVRRALDGEPMVTLDDKTRALSGNMLVIADGEKPVAVAGVMGGQNSEIKDTTSTIVFESANFKGSSVRLTAKALNMRTDSSSRFEKGLDPELTLPALLRACQLVETLGAGKVVGGIIDVDAGGRDVRKIPFEPEKINALLGLSLESGEMLKLLSFLEIKHENNLLYIPTFRDDLEGTVDIAEEVARLYGYDIIPVTSIHSRATRGGFTPKQVFDRVTRATLEDLGYSEILTYSFVSPSGFDLINLPQDSELRKALPLINPLGEDTGIMRTSSLPSIFAALSRNFSRRLPSALLYELAMVYTPVIKNGEVDKGTLPYEHKLITLAGYGTGFDFFALKGSVEALLYKLNIAGAQYRACDEYPSFHPGRCAEISVADNIIGVIGELHPTVIKNYDIDHQLPCAGYLDFDKLFAISDAVVKKYQPLPKFPAVTRDIALVCRRDIPVGDLERTIYGCGATRLREVTLFDVYTGSQIDESKKSVAFSLTLRADDQTLTDADAEEDMRKILSALANEHNAVLRQ